jgi:lipopolysaccharide export system protein LptA
MVKGFSRLWCLAACLLFHEINGQEATLLEKDDAMVINSGEAQYDGKEIVLSGQVVVQHGLGQISARRLSLLPSSHSGKKNKFAFLKISEDVQIELRGGGKLYCQQAEVDYAKMQGIFSGSAEAPDVTYLNTGEGTDASKKTRPPLEVKSDQMIFHLLREAATSKTLVKQIEASHNVRVSYNQDYLLLADDAFYQRMPSANSAHAGLLTLSVRGDNPVCQMTNANGDRLNAQSIQVNTAERQLWLDQPQGVLYMRREKWPTQAVEFSANELVWDDQKQTLHLRGRVNMTHNGTVHVQTDHEIAMAQALVNDKRTLRFIQSPQQTKIAYLDVEKGNHRHIYCPGPLVIDHERQVMTLQGLPNAAGQIEESQQVYVEDLLGEMYADHVSIHYSWRERQLVPEKVTLEGHVRLLNRFDGHPEEAGTILHYALADRVNYLPKQQEMTLDGTQGNRVLFFDKVNNVQMSAPSLKVRHDMTTRKDAIQGFGDVRFTFIEKELAQLKQRFRLEESSHKELGNDQSKK